MDTKRYLTLVLVGLLFTLPLLTGCFKKGEQDPFFSMLTRKTRVTGEWEVVSFNSVIRENSSLLENEIVTTIEIEDKEVWYRHTNILNSPEEDEDEGDVVRYRMRFDDNGRMSSYYNYTFEKSEYDENTGVTTTVNTDVKEEITGTWNFLAGIDDYKNRERLAIVIEERKTVKITSTLEVGDDFDPEEDVLIPIIEREVTAERWDNGEMSTIYELIMLKNREVIMHQNVNTLEVSSKGLESFSLTQVGEQTWEMEKL